MKEKVKESKKISDIYYENIYKIDYFMQNNSIIKCKTS